MNDPICQSCLKPLPHKPVQDPITGEYLTNLPEYVWYIHWPTRTILCPTCNQSTNLWKEHQ